MSLPGLSLSDQSVSQRIDLEEVFGVDFSGNEALKIAIGQRIVDYMRTRTESGRDVYGKAFASYSQSYKKSAEFTAYGKTNKVDMTLTGDMLASIDFESEGNVLTFLFDNSEDESKAYGHMTGMAGHKVLSGKTPKREFFGITRDDIDKVILPDFQEDIDAMKSTNTEPVSLLEALFGTNTEDPGSVQTLSDLIREYF